MAIVPDEIGKTGGSMELTELLEGLSGGLMAKDPADGIQEIDFWHEKLTAKNDTALAPIVENLGRLKEALSESTLSHEHIGHALLLLGESIEAYAEDYEGPACDQLEQLGTLLRTEGTGISSHMLTGEAKI